MKKQPDNGKITARYEHLSHDDERAGESVSIENQKRILEDYARKNRFTNIRHFTGDGVRGTTFKRPGLDAMLEEIRAGNVSTVIIKDQSRIGRDVVGVGLLKRTFDEYHVRFIAANDNLGTANGFDIMPILAYENEEEVGSAMKKSGVPREDIFLTSKVWVEHYGYLSCEEQEKVSGLAEQGKIKLDAKTAKCMKEIAGELTEGRVLEKLGGTKVKKDAGSRTIKLSADVYERYFAEIKTADVAGIVEEALAAWFGKGGMADVPDQ